MPPPTPTCVVHHCECAHPEVVSQPWHEPVLHNTQQPAVVSNGGEADESKRGNSSKTHKHLHVRTQHIQLTVAYSSIAARNTECNLARATSVAAVMLQQLDCSARLIEHKKCEQPPSTLTTRTVVLH
eukprot:GHUV01044581.1.p1 GENE.GHUV01044581.1~~GHUV01044581.1.p1  ORF type:complete len:127 (+),score=26.46 GHUV01044581.1:747-1127(+)